MVKVSKATYETIKRQPTADVVEVVRCKDCVNWDDTKGASYGECHLLDILSFPRDFCSYGERIEQ